MIELIENSIKTPAKISSYDKLMEKISWSEISATPGLTTEFIIENSEVLDWCNIFKHQQLECPAMFIDKISSIDDWFNIFQFQNLDNEFIDEFCINVDTAWILGHQELAKTNPRYLEYVQPNEELCWQAIFIKNKLSNTSIIKFHPNVSMNIILESQTIDTQLDNYFKNANNKAYLDHANIDWSKMNVELKKELLSKIYKIVNIEGVDYVECYKSVRQNFFSIYLGELSTRFIYNNFSGKLYETTCDYNSSTENSYGFGCWTIGNANKFAFDHGVPDCKILKVIAPITHVCMTHKTKIRCAKMKLIEEVQFVENSVNDTRCYSRSVQKIMGSLLKKFIDYRDSGFSCYKRIWFDSFSVDYLDTTVICKLSSDFPFCPPIMSFSGVGKNISAENATKYCEPLRTQWTPAYQNLPNLIIAIYSECEQKKLFD